MPTKPHQVKPGPDKRRENVVSYYEYGADFFERHFGRRPSRNTLYKYLIRGYPIIRNGPRVRVPIFDALKRPMTTEQAMDRFLTLIRHLEKQEDVASTRA